MAKLYVCNYANEKYYPQQLLNTQSAYEKVKWMWCWSFMNKT